MSTKAQQIRVYDETPDAELPEGWAETKLGAVVDSMKNGLYKPASKYSDRGVACLRMYNIDHGNLIWKDIKRMSLSSGEVEEYRLAPGDLLVNRVNSRELVGKSAVFPKGLEACVFESKNIRVRLISELVNSDFANYWLFRFGRRYFEFNSQQVVGMASISQPQIADLPLLLPPKAEQERIVRKVKDLQKQASTTKARLEKIATLLKGFRKAVLAAACSGKLTEDWRILHGRPQESADGFAEWKTVELKEVADTVDPNPSHRYPSYQNGTVPIFATEQMTGLDGWDTSTAKLVNASFHAERESAHGFKKDDIIFARKGRLGFARRPPNMDRYVFSHTMFIVRTHPGTISDYLLWYLRQDKCVAWLLNEMNPNTGVPTLGKSYMEKLLIQLPPKDEQQEIVRRVDALFKLADAMEKRVAAASARAEKLKQAILAKAFRGELVPTEAELARRDGRTYEPASVLLERIKAERARAEEKTPRQGRKARAAAAVEQ